MKLEQTRRRAWARPFGGAASLALILGLAACGQEDGGGQNANAQTAQSTPVDSQSQSSPAAAEEIDIAALEVKGYALGDVVLGDPNAPVTMIEYASLTCPACKAFHEQTLPTIKREYIDTGKLQLIVRELYGHRIGLYGAALARCAGPEKYHAFLGVLFSRQDNYRTQDPAENLAELRRIGKLGGLSPERIETCLNDNVFLNALYQTSSANLDKDSVPATPYLILQPGPDQQTIRGAVDAAQLSGVIDSLLP